MDILWGRNIIQPPTPGVTTFLGTWTWLSLGAPTVHSILQELTEYLLFNCLFTNQSPHCEAPRGTDGVTLLLLVSPIPALQ